MGVRGMQVNSLRGPTAPQASLAHHLTAIPDEGLRTNELVKQMSEQAREGWGVESGCTGLLWLQLDLPPYLHTSAITAPHPSVSNSFLFFSLLSWSFFQRALSLHVLFNISLPIPLVHLHSCNPIVLLGWNSLFLNCTGRLSSRCFDRMLSSYAHRQWTVKKKAVDIDWSSVSHESGYQN